MKVLLINGSPHQQGCTFTALTEVAKAIEDAGITTEIYHIGNQPIRGCCGCKSCRSKSGRCTFDDDGVNTVLAQAEQADGFIFGSPVHFAGASGSVTSFLDRLFYAGSGIFAYKPGAAIVTCRRGGATAAFEQLNKYFMYAQMPIVSSQYWNMAHGNTPEEIVQDAEGMQIMRVLGRNMAWLLKSIEAGRLANIELPQKEQKVVTSFIR